MARFYNMFFSMVLIAFAVVQSVRAGYEYPKPSVPFELPNSLPIQDSGGQVVAQTSTQEQQKTISYSIPYEDYHYLHQHKNENANNIVNIGGGINSSKQNLKLSALQDLTSLEPITTELNANIDGTASFQSAVVQSHVTREPEVINSQPILNSANNPQVILSPLKIVSPPVDLQTTTSPVISTQNIQGSDLLEISNNIPSILDDIPNSVSIRNNLSPVLHLLSNSAPIANGQNNHLQPPNLVNAPSQSFNVQITDHNGDIQHNQVQLNTHYDIPLATLPLQHDTSLNIQNGALDVVNVNNGAPHLLDSRNYLQSTNYQSDESSLLSVSNNINQFPNAQNFAEPVITKHIYFHVPPPDIEEAPVVRAPLPPKKIYKIVFIKLPAQESKNNVQLQAALQNQLAPIEDKTLIYVLVKKPESTQVVPSAPKLSEHEVLFVNYKGNPTTTESVDDTLIRNNVFGSEGLTLQPGRINGNK